MDETKAPADFTERRIKDCFSAKALYSRIRQDGDPRRRQYARVMNQLNGGKPLDDNELIKAGQGWRCNVNFRDASSMLEQVYISHWRLLHDSSNLAAVTVHNDTPLAETAAQAFQAAFNRFIEDQGDSYVRNYMHLVTNVTGFGVGVAVFNDQKSPRWEAVRVGDIDVESRAKMDVSSLRLACITQEMDVAEFWERIRTPRAKEASKKIGWNPEAITTLLWRHKTGNENNTPSSDDLIAIEEDYRNNSLSMSVNTSSVKVVHMFVKEYDGKISRMIFCPEHEHGEYLFNDSELENRPTDMRECIQAIFFEAGNGLFYGSKGFGQKNFQLASITNKLKCRAVDSTILSGLNFKDMSDGNLTQVPIENKGPINIFPKDFEQVSTYPQSAPVFDTIRMLSNQTDQNNARFRDQANMIANTQTAQQASLLANLQTQVDVASATFYLKQVAALFTEQFRRLRLRGNTDPDAKNFKARCLAMGLDEDTFHNVEITVRTGSDPGAASIAVRAMAAKELLAMAADPNVEKRWAWETYISSVFGAQAVNKALTPADATGDVSAQRLALMENASMGDGMPIPVSPRDNHVEHIPIHMQVLGMKLREFSQSGRYDPNLGIMLQFALPHLEAHIVSLKGNKVYEQQYQEFWAQFKDIAAQAQSAFSQLERLAEQSGVPGAAPGSSAPSVPGGIGAMSPQ